MQAVSEPSDGTAGPVLRVLPGSADERNAAFRALYEVRYVDLVRFATFMVGDAHAAEDLSQEAFVRLYDAWDRLEDPNQAIAYLRVTVVNLSRSRHRRAVVAERKPLRLVPVASAEDSAMSRLHRNNVLAAVAALPNRQRACVVMRHWLRMTESEIASTLEMSIGSVRTHNKRGVQSLQRTLGDLR